MTEKLEPEDAQDPSNRTLEERGFVKLSLAPPAPDLRRLALDKALEHAERKRSGVSLSASEVVKVADKFLAFLRGDEEAQSHG